MGNGVAAISPRHQPYKEKARRDASGLLLLYYCRQRPTLPHSFPCSTIGGIRLNFRVRNGNGCDPDPMTTGKLAAWGFRLRACGASARQAYSSACLDAARVASEVGIVPDNLCKERKPLD